MMVLQQLQIDNIVLIQHADVTFDPTMNIITGASGSGKTMMLKALGLIFGQRAQKESIGPYATKASVTAHFHCPKNHPLRAFLSQEKIPCPGEGLMVIQRSISQQGKNDISINKHPVALKTLQALSTQFVIFFQQHQHTQLFDPASHLSIIDQYGAHHDMINLVDQHFQTLDQTEKTIATLSKKLQVLEQNQALFQYQKQELDALELQENSYSDLCNQQQQLQHQEDLLNCSQSLCETLYENAQQSVYDQLSTCISKIDHHLAMDQELAPLLEQLQLIQEQCQDVFQSIRSKKEHYLQQDATALDGINEKMTLMLELARKHQTSPEMLYLQSEKMQQQQQQIRDFKTKLETLEIEREQAQSHYNTHAQALRVAREKTALSLQQALQQYLVPLGLGKSHMHFVFHNAPPSPTGIDHLQWLMSTNPGQALAPIENVLSGGEAARIQLALMQLIGQKQTAIMIFDEIDTGVSGQLAKAMGTVLQNISSTKQVIAITHLAPIAALGKVHLHISKKQGDKKTTTTIASIKDSTERTKILAEILSGQINDHSQALATALLDGEKETISH